MFLRTFEALIAGALYVLLMLLGLLTAGLFSLIVFGAPWWLALILGLLAGLVLCWFARGVLRNLGWGRNI